jgi:hypothetical protein
MTFRWAVLTPWQPFNVLWNRGEPLLFHTRKEARSWAKENYGYILTRPDLRTDPHNWRMPRPVMVSVKLEVL